MAKQKTEHTPHETERGMQEDHIDLLPPDMFSELHKQINAFMESFEKITDNDLNMVQRRRMTGPGNRNYGFVKIVSEFAEAEPRYAQFFETQSLNNAVHNIVMCRGLIHLLQSFTRAVSNTMLVNSDSAFSMSLMFYNTVQQMARRGDSAAVEMFRTLQTVFRRKKRVTAEPTVKEIERDVHALLKGKKEGTVIVEGTTAKATAGSRTIVDDVHKNTVAVKKSSRRAGR